MEVSQRAFRPVFKALIHLGLIEIAVVGSWMRIPGFGTQVGRGKVTRIRPTNAFLEVTRRHGIKRNSADRHFPQLGPPSPLELRGASTRVRRTRIRGRPLTYDETRKTAELRADVDELNSFSRQRRVEGIEETRLTGWTRIFHQIGTEPFSWDHGGRLYARPGNASYQSRSKEERAQLQIDGEPVVEIDIRSSHLAIVYALSGQSPHEHFRQYNEDGRSWQTADPYDLPGFPRSVIKCWVTATFGAGRPPKRWSSAAIQSLAEEGINLRAHPVGAVGAAVMQRHPVLANLGNINWAKLQFVESEAIIRSILRLKRDHVIPALPVHDSLIVPRSAWWVALRVLQDELQRVTGYQPMLPKLTPPMTELPAPHKTRYADQIPRYFTVVTPSQAECPSADDASSF